MNTIDDFAQLRPAVDPPSREHLAGLWSDIAGEPATADLREAEGDSPSVADPTQVIVDLDVARRSGRSTRRFAIAGAAASLALGVGALALFSGRADAPVIDRNAGSPAVSTPASTQVIDGQADIGEIGEPPMWGMSVPGWTLTEFDDNIGERSERGETVRLFAGPDGVEESWVAIVSGMSDPLAPIGSAVPLLPYVLGVPADAVPVEGAEGDSAITAERLVDSSGNFLVVAGGVSRETAASVFGAAGADGPLPAGFEALPEETGSALLRRVSYRFENEAGDSVWIDVEPGGQPLYDFERVDATALEAFDQLLGVDDASIAFGDQYTVVARTGFWVSTIRTSTTAGFAAEFTALAGLVQLDPSGVSPDPRSAPPSSVAQETVSPATSERGPTSIERLAIGDQVLLAPANKLNDGGLAVDASVSRSFIDGVAVIEDLAETRSLPDVLVVSLGVNGLFTQQDVDRMMDAIGPDRSVTVVTIRLTGAFDDSFSEIWEANNRMLRALPEAHANVTVFDWAVESEQCPGDCFLEDNLHLTATGADFFAGLLLEAVPS
jgi:hypothetical protein